MMVAFKGKGGWGGLSGLKLSLYQGLSTKWISQLATMIIIQWMKGTPG